MMVSVPAVTPTTTATAMSMTLVPMFNNPKNNVVQLATSTQFTVGLAGYYNSC